MSVKNRDLAEHGPAVLISKGPRDAYALPGARYECSISWGEKFGAGDRGRTGDVQLGNPPNNGNDEEPEG